MPITYAIVNGRHPVKNFHLPLPDDVYRQLRAEAQRTQVPATTLAREAIDLWLRHQLRKARHDVIAAYAAETAGSDVDLDRELESAGIEHLDTRWHSRRRRGTGTWTRFSPTVLRGPDGVSGCQSINLEARENCALFRLNPAGDPDGFGIGHARRLPLKR